MQYSNQFKRVVLISLFAVIIAWACEDDENDDEFGTDDDTEGDTDSDSDADADSDADSDVDSDTDSDADGDTDSDSDSDSDSGRNICDETVPMNHYVDGIPAYKQCDDSRDGAIWSNDGVNTSTVSLGDDWIRTQGSGGYQCTEFCKRYLRFVWDITRTPGGNAGAWCDHTPPEGLEQTMWPVHGDIGVFKPGDCGAGPVGHVTVVDVVHEADEEIEIVEQNGANRRKCPIDTVTCFIHVIEN